MEFSSIKVEQLYIKLDKKLIVRAKSLVLPKAQEEAFSLEKSAFLIDNFLFIDQLFETIHIEQLHHRQEAYMLYFTRNTFFIESNSVFANYSLSAQILCIFTI